MREQKDRRQKGERKKERGNDEKSMQLKERVHERKVTAKIQ